MLQRREPPYDFPQTMFVLVEPLVRARTVAKLNNETVEEKRARRSGLVHKPSVVVERASRACTSMELPKRDEREKPVRSRKKPNTKRAS